MSVAPTKDRNPPPDTRYLSEYDTHVDKETAARERDPFAKHVQPKKTEGADSIAGSPAPPKVAQNERPPGVSPGFATDTSAEAGARGSRATRRICRNCLACSV